MKMSTHRKLPRPFTLPWGRGQVIEEISIFRPHWEPTIQLLQFEDGSEALRFCYYTGTKFGRGPLIASAEDLLELKGLANSLTTKLCRLLNNVT